MHIYTWCSLSCRTYRSQDTYVLPSHPVHENINKYYIISQKTLNFQILALNFISPFLSHFLPVILVLVIVQLLFNFKYILRCLKSLTFISWSPANHESFLNWQWKHFNHKERRHKNLKFNSNVHSRAGISTPG